MIAASFLLVVVSAVCLVTGVLFTEDVWLILISIGAALLAGLLLGRTLLRDGPRPDTAARSQWAPPQPPTGGADPATPPPPPPGRR